MKIVIPVRNLSDRMIPMLNRSFNHRVICHVRRSTSIRSDFPLTHRMKTLNANEQYAKVLDLFEEHKQDKTIQHISGYIIIQALKACTQMGDLQRGKAIHRLVSARVKSDGYILSSLIHFYSKWGFQITMAFF